MNQQRIRKMAIRIFSTCLLSSTTIYSAKNESNVPPLQHLVANSLVKNRVPLEFAAPALNDNIHLKNPYSQESKRLGEWPGVKKVNKEYKKLKNDICNNNKPLNAQNARLIFYPSGPWDSEGNKRYKKCLFDCIDNGCFPFYSHNMIDTVLKLRVCFIIMASPCIMLSPPESICSDTYTNVASITLLCCCSTTLLYNTCLKKLTNPKTWQSSTAPQSLTMSEDVGTCGSSNFAASSNMLNVALKMKED